MIDKDKIHNLVGVFYQPTFKTFFINSVDGETFIKPIGIFVSLKNNKAYDISNF